jgi:hypothetical protein
VIRFDDFSCHHEAPTWTQRAHTSSNVVV